MERSENAALDSSPSSEPQFDCLANSLIQLLETAKQDLEGDRQAAKASLAKASSILQSEVDRRSGANGAGTGGLAGWQIARVRAFIDKNLRHHPHRGPQRSRAAKPGAFCTFFQAQLWGIAARLRDEETVGKSLSSDDDQFESLSQIALSVGFSDQSHLCKRFKEALGQSPSNWRRERELFDTPSSHQASKD